MKKRPLKRRLGILGKYPGFFMLGLFFVAVGVLTVIYFRSGVNNNETVDGGVQGDTSKHIIFDEENQEEPQIEVPGIDDKLSGRTKPSQASTQTSKPSSQSSQASADEGNNGDGEQSVSSENSKETPVSEPSEAKTSEPKKSESNTQEKTKPEKAPEHNPE